MCQNFVRMLINVIYNNACLLHLADFRSKTMKETEFLNKIGTNIKSIRMQRSLSQVDLAYTCGFDKASMSRIESGKANPTVLTLYKISKALDVPINQLCLDISLKE